jgi:hypothetical protein
MCRLNGWSVAPVWSIKTCRLSPSTSLWFLIFAQIAPVFKKVDPYLPLKGNLGRALFKPQSRPRKPSLESRTENRLSASKNNEISRNMVDRSTRNRFTTWQPKKKFPVLPSITEYKEGRILTDYYKEPSKEGQASPHTGSNAACEVNEPDSELDGELRRP